MLFQLFSLTILKFSRGREEGNIIRSRKKFFRVIGTKNNGEKPEVSNMGQVSPTDVLFWEA